MKTLYQSINEKIKLNEQCVSLDILKTVDECQLMSSILAEQLNVMRQHVIINGFNNDEEEIAFFKSMKPRILGKLLFYNKVLSIETIKPHYFGQICERYFSEVLVKLEQNYRELSSSEFYRYYRSGSTRYDQLYFKRGNIDTSIGISSHMFDTDWNFTTYYDYKVSKIIENDLLHDYLNIRLEEGLNVNLPLYDGNPMTWTSSKSALVELIYALYAAECIGKGNVSIGKLTAAFEQLFNIKLGDMHHIFHRMKYRAGSRALFLDSLKKAMESYMDKEFL